MTIELVRLSLLAALVSSTFVYTAAKVDPPTISSELASSFIATLNTSQDGSTVYKLVVVPKHGSGEKIEISNYVNGTKVTALRADTLYDVTVIAKYGGRPGVEETSEPAVAHTLPLPPNLTLKTALPGSVLVFFNTTNRAQVSKWTIQYREEGNESSLETEVINVTYAYGLLGLTANIRYEVRARPSQLRGSRSVSEAEVGFSDWKVFTTGRLSVFGRVDLTNVTLNGTKAEVDSQVWNRSLEMVRGGYESIRSDRVGILRIEDRGGRARVHYRIEVDDKTLPSSTNYSLTGEEYENSLINNGGTADGTPYYLSTDREFTLLYSSSSKCSKIVERYFIVTPENEPPGEIHLNVASSDATTPEEDDSLFLEPSGDVYLLKRDDGLVAPGMTSVKANTVVGLTPKFVVKDCLVAGPENESLYSEILSAQKLGASDSTYNIMIATDPLADGLKSSDIVYSSSKNWSYFSLDVPAMDRVVRYEIQHSGEVIGSLGEDDLDSSRTWKIISSKYVPNTTYNIRASITFRSPSRTTSTVSGQEFSVTPGGPQCDSCSDNSICTTHVGDGSVDCTCLEAFQGDGATCVPDIDPLDIVYSSRKDWSGFSLDVPVLDKVIGYEVLQSGIVIGSLGEENLKSSDTTWKIIVSEYVPNTTYNILASVTFRSDDGSNFTVRSSEFPVTPGGPQCDSCSEHFVCTTRVGDGSVNCTCLRGLQADIMARKPLIDPSDIVYSFSKNWSYLSLNVRHLLMDKVIKSEVLQFCKVIGSLEREDLESTNTTREIIVDDYVPNTVINIKVSITFRDDGGRHSTMQSSEFPVIPGGPQCGSCSDTAICSVHVGNNSAKCTCIEGLEGNGTTCVRREPEPLCSSCSGNATCSTRGGNGNVKCMCTEGFQGDGTTCEKIPDDQSWIIVVSVLAACIVLLLLLLFVYRKWKKKRSGYFKPATPDAIKLEDKQQSEQISDKSDIVESVKTKDDNYENV